MSRTIDELIPGKDQREYIDSRIRDIDNAGQRSRWLYGLMIAISWVLIAMAFNTTLSFMRDFAGAHENELVSIDVSSGAANANPPVTDSSSPAQSQEPKPPASKADDAAGIASSRPQVLGRQAMIQQLLRNWVDSLYFEVPVIGARFGAPDAGIIGGILLCILGVWSLYSARRENHLIFYIIRDTEKYETEEKFRKYLKNQLHATQLFAKSRRPEALSAANLRPRGSTLAFQGPCELTVRRYSVFSPGGEWQEAPCGKAIQMTASEGIACDSEAHPVLSNWRTLESDVELWVTPADEYKVAGQAGMPQLGEQGTHSRAPTLRLKGQVDWRLVDDVVIRSRAILGGFGERAATALIFFLPPIALFIVFAGDIGTLFMNSPVRAELSPDARCLADVLCPDWNCPGLLTRLSVALALLALNTSIMQRAYGYQKATNSLLSYIDQVCWTRRPALAAAPAAGASPLDPESAAT